MADKSIIRAATSAAKAVAGVAIGAAAAAATSVVIESVAKSMAKGNKVVEQDPTIEKAVRAKLEKPVQQLTDRLLAPDAVPKKKKKKATTRKKAAAPVKARRKR